MFSFCQHKSEAFITELALCKNDAIHAINHLSEWMKPEKVGIANFAVKRTANTCVNYQFYFFSFIDFNLVAIYALFFNFFLLVSSIYSIFFKLRNVIAK